MSHDAVPPTVERREILPGYTISRVIRGGWQLAGGHGDIERETAIEDLIAAYDAGITTFDCADIYTGVEEIYGLFRERLIATRGRDAVAALRVHTKLVPDLSLLSSVTKSDIEAIVDRSLQRLKLDRLDVVQFHWWDYAEPKWLDALHWLREIAESGKIAVVGGTNFDCAHMRELLGAGIPMKTLQLQYSLVDHRPENGMVALAEREGIALFCYGSVAGGFLSDAWLGKPEPRHPLENRSLTKYKLIIDDFGGWDLFQALLRTLRCIADRHDTDIASVAGRAVLDRPGVAAIIVGARNRRHVSANAGASAIRLTAEDRRELEAVLAARKGPEGDVYTLERDRTGRHGSIMKYNLNTSSH
ncbi:aldo/keto reductase [Methyloraptor flagellatus]|uniref:Aldo/keto reductase n=1 Tax=Methyloraptor flagellatus TaxID=3162530 RepID=A0AAU7XDG7_9HYPH